MLTRPPPSHLARLVLVVVGTACGSDSSVGPNSSPATLEQAFTELTLPALSVTHSIAALHPSGSQLWAGCAYTAASQSFVCPSATASDLTINRSFTLLTASGAKQSAFDPATTASVTTNTAAAGTITDESGPFTVDAQEELTLSGLLTGPHQLNGSSDAHFTGVLSEWSADFDARTTGSITNVILPASTAPGAEVWPVSGMIVLESSSSIGDLPPSMSRLKMTFNGTSTVTVTITTDGVTRTCQQDLARPEAPVCG